MVIIVIIIIIIVIIIIIIVIIIIIMSKWIHSSILEFAVIAWQIVLAGRKDPAKTNPFFSIFFYPLKKIKVNFVCSLYRSAKKK